VKKHEQHQRRARDAHDQFPSNGGTPQKTHTMVRLRLQFRLKKLNPQRYLIVFRITKELRELKVCLEISALALFPLKTASRKIPNKI
jgi:hypothetical protein